MGKILELDLFRPMDQRIQIMKRFNKNGRFLEQMAIPEDLRESEYPFQFHQADSEIDKLIKLALNTANEIRKDE